MKQKSVGLTLRALILALVLSLVAGTPALPPLDGVAYAQSSGLTAVVAPNNSSVTLDWTAVSGADSYEIWRGEVVGGQAQWGNSAYATVEPVAPATEPATTYTDSSVTAGTTYAYGVRSVTGGTPAGWTGPYPNVTIGGGVAAPTARATVTVAADGNTAVDVTWTDVSGATGYYIQYWHAGLDDWMRIGDDQTSPYKHTGLTPGTEYYYVVAGYNDGGMGPWSSWRTDNSNITLEATTAVPVLTLTRVDRTTARLDWTRTAAGAEYELQRRKITTLTSTADAQGARTTQDIPADDTGWGRLGLLSGTSHTDSAANYVPATDAATGGVTEDTAVARKVKYEYRVRAIDGQGIAGDWSKMKSMAVPAAGAVLTAPSISASTLSATSIQVSWAEIAGADHYELQWKSGDRGYSTSIRIEPPDSGRPLYNHPGLTPSTKYTYQVRAVDVNGASDWSGAKSATTLGTTDTAGQMPQVTGLTVTDTTANNDGNTRTARLTWNAVTGVTHYQIQRYDPSAADPAWTNVQRTANPAVGTDGRLAAADATGTPFFNDEFDAAAAAFGKTYYYVVSAIDDRTGEITGDTAAENDIMGEWSRYQSVTFKKHKPNTPTGLAAVGTSGSSILVTWASGGTTAATNGDARAEPDSYTLQWKIGNSAWNTISGVGTPYHHTGLRGNSTYYYRVRAETSGGDSDYYPAPADLANQVSVELGNTLNPPTGLRAVDKTLGTADHRIELSWTAAPNANEYEVQRWHVGGSAVNTGNAQTGWADLSGATPTGDDDETTVAGGSATTVKFIDDNDDDSATNKAAGAGSFLEASTTYYYRVRSVKESAKSGWSAVVTGTTRRATLALPLLRATTTGQSMIRLSWQPVPGATSYVLEFAEGAYDSTTLGTTGVNRTTIPLASGINHYVHTGRKTGTQYSYRMRALGANDLKSGWSANAVQPFTKPAQPQLSAASAVPSHDAIKLSWDAVSFASATAATSGRLRAQTNYRIERRASGVTTWTAIDGTAGTDTADTAVACTTANKCTFTDANLEPSTTYYYRIRAEVLNQSVSLGGTGADTGVNYMSYWDNANQRTTAE